MNPFDGFEVYESEFLVVRKQTKFPRSKKKRIRKKWAKQDKNWTTTPLPTMIRMGFKLFAHPATIARLKKEINEENRSQPIPNRYSPTGH